MIKWSLRCVCVYTYNDDDDDAEQRVCRYKVNQHINIMQKSK